MTDKLIFILTGRKNTRREKGLINVIVALMSVTEMITGQGYPALPCTLPCPVAGQGGKIHFYPALLQGRAGCRAGYRVKSLYPANLN